MTVPHYRRPPMRADPSDQRPPAIQSKSMGPTAVTKKVNIQQNPRVFFEICAICPDRTALTAHKCFEQKSPNGCDRLPALNYGWRLSEKLHKSAGQRPAPTQIIGQQKRPKFHNFRSSEHYSRPLSTWQRCTFQFWKFPASDLPGNIQLKSRNSFIAIVRSSEGK
jgi:hypothetical protein